MCVVGVLHFEGSSRRNPKKEWVCRGCVLRFVVNREMVYRGGGCCGRFVDEQRERAVLERA